MTTQSQLNKSAIADIQELPVQLNHSEDNLAMATEILHDIADLIAGELKVSRGTAYDMMREALAEQPATVQQEKSPPEQWVERWYGSTEKGWWICCGREHIAHLGTEVSSDEVRKIVDAHNRYKLPPQPKEPEQPAQQQEPVEIASSKAMTDADWDRLLKQPPQRKPLTDEQVWNDDDLMKLNAVMMLPMDYFMRVVRAIEAAHGITEQPAPIESRMAKVKAEHLSANSFTDLYESVNNIKDKDGAA